MTPVAAVSYSRRSSDPGDGNYSHEYQDEANLKLAERESLRVVESVSEDITGTIHLRDRKPSRAEIKRGDVRRHGSDVWELITAQKIKAIIVYRIDRLSRASTMHALMLIDDILRAGCKIYISSTGKQITDPDDIATIIDAWQSNKEKTALVEKLRDGRTRKAKAKWIGDTHPPYGYKKNGIGKDARLVIDKEQAKVVRAIFERYANGAASLRSIAEWLNEKNIPAPQGRIWYRATVHLILKSKIYIGITSWAGVESMNKQLVIVQLHTWQQAQDRFEMNFRLSPRRAKEQYLMRGRITCWCGCKMHIKSTSGRRRYRCNATANPAAIRCSGIVNAAQIDTIAVDYIRLVVTDEDFLRSGIAELERREAEQLAGRSVSDIDADLGRAQAALDRLYRAFGDSGDDDDLRAVNDAKGRLSDLKAEKDKIINAAQNRLVLRAQRESVADRVRNMRRHMAAPSFELLSELADIINVRARLNRDDGRVVIMSCDIAPERVYRLD